jgi:hypothetical protein
MNADAFEERQEAHGRWTLKWSQRGERAWQATMACAIAIGPLGLAHSWLGWPAYAWLALVMFGLWLATFVIWRLIMRHYLRGVDRHIDECIKDLQEWRAG